MIKHLGGRNENKPLHRSGVATGDGKKETDHRELSDLQEGAGRLAMTAEA